MEVLRAVVLIGATLTMGLMAGVFWIYSNAIMPGLRSTDDRTFVGGFQAIDRAIINPVFMAVFVGPLALSGGAVALALADDEWSIVSWAFAAFALYLVVFISTIAVNVPLNDALKAAGEPDETDLSTVREAFNEAKWVRWNHGRALASTVGFVCLAWALVEHGATT